MTDVAWAIPAAIALTGGLLVAAIVVLVVRVRHRSPRAQAAAAEAVTAAEAALLDLDDAVDSLDIAFEAADALPAGDAPADLRRAYTAAQRARDRGFSDVSSLRRGAVVPARRRVEAERLRAGLVSQLARVEETRTQLAAWSTAHRTPAALVAAARRRRDEAVTSAGDPAPLLAALGDRFDADDWRDAALSARAGHAALIEADTEIDRAAARDADVATVMMHLHRSTDATRRAGRHLRAVEDSHRIALQAADNVTAELAAARAELGAAIELATARADACAPGAQARLLSAVRDLDDAAAHAPRRPRTAVETVARVREVRDDALGEAPSTRHRLEVARTALPGTLACARAALAAADAREGVLAIDARLRLETARRELAAARAATDAVVALANARAAWHAVSSAEL